MVRVTCLSPTKSYSYCSSLLFSSCSLAILDLQSLNDDPSTRGYQRATIQNNQKDTSKNNTPKQKKGFKNILKDRARCYGYGDARNAENGTKTANLWTKRCFRDLVAIN